jgi:hypothetical protein
MTFVPKYLTSKRWEKVGGQELLSTPYNKEIDPQSFIMLYAQLFVKTPRANHQNKTKINA